MKLLLDLRRVIFLCSTIIVFLSYVFVYTATVEREGTPFGEFRKWGFFRPSYGRRPESFSHFLYPAHWIDRRIRYEYWHVPDFVRDLDWKMPHSDLDSGGNYCR